MGHSRTIDRQRLPGRPSAHPSAFGPPTRYTSHTCGRRGRRDSQRHERPDGPLDGTGRRCQRAGRRWWIEVVLVRHQSRLFLQNCLPEYKASALGRSGWGWQCRWPGQFAYSSHRSAPQLRPGYRRVLPCMWRGRRRWLKLNEQGWRETPRMLRRCSRRRSVVAFSRVFALFFTSLQNRFRFLEFL